MIVYAVVDDALSPDFPLGDAIETFIGREDAERFIEEVRGDGPEVAVNLRIEEPELEAGGFELAPHRLPGPQNGRSASARAITSSTAIQPAATRCQLIRHPVTA